MTSEAWTQRVGALAAVPALIRQLGADPADTMMSAGLAPDSLDHPEDRIPYAAFGRLYREAEKRTGCAYFGLLAGRAWHLSSMGLVGTVTLNSATVGEALRRLTVTQHLNSQGGLSFLRERGGVVEAGYAIYHKDVEATDQIYDSMMAAGVNFIRELCGASWNPAEVRLSRRKPDDVEPYRRLFRAPLRFDSEYTALSFPAHWMERPVAGADPGILRSAERAVAAAGRGQFVHQVHRVLRALLLNGSVSGDDVAEILSMHRRTLNRRLKAQGTTFQKLLDQARFDVARQLLAGTRVTIDDIAAALGYAGVSPFMRTFQRWAGTTPARWRRAAIGK